MLELSVVIMFSVSIGLMCVGGIDIRSNRE